MSEYLASLKPNEAADNDHTKYKSYASKPNIVTIISDDTGYWDLGAYGGGMARGVEGCRRVSGRWPRY